MTKKVLRPISIILSIMMILSVFTIVPMTASAEGAVESPNFVRATETSELDNIGSCTFEQAKAWAEANLDDLIQARHEAGGGVNPYVLILYNKNGNIASYIWVNQNDALGAFDGAIIEISEAKEDMAGGNPAYYIPAPNGCTVTWKNGDTVLETDANVEEGAAPVYNGETPTKDNDEDYSYTFSGWTNSSGTFYAKDAALPTVTGDETYTATFSAKLLWAASVTVGETITKYATFSDALAAWADGSTLTVLDDLTLNSAVSVTGTDKTLDVNGHTFTVNNGNNYASLVVEAGASLTVKGSGILGANKRIENNGTLNFYDAQVGSIMTFNRGRTNIYSGTISTPNGWVGVNSEGSDVVVNVYGGTVYSNSWLSFYADSAAINIYDGIFNIGNDNNSILMDTNRGGTITVYGGYYPNRIADAVYTLGKKR